MRWNDTHSNGTVTQLRKPPSAEHGPAASARKPGNEPVARLNAGAAHGCNAERPGNGEAGGKGDFSGGRLVDIVISLCALIFLAPLMLVVAALVYIVDPGPVLFGHRRLGKDGRTFRCWKFRSMVVDADARLQKLLAEDPRARFEWARDHKLRNDPRITSIGHFLRRSSIDELPQFFNVLMGEMSLVGPRPIVREEVAKYGRYFASYCRVRPGITGLWQISGRNDISYRRRVAIDVAYVRSKSVALDLGILLLTVPRVMAARGSY